VDFLLQQKGNAILIEIKTPQTRLLGSRYRSVYPPSHELAGAVTQLLAYRTSLQQELASLAYHTPGLRAVNPQAFLLIGDIQDEAFTMEQEESFELFRNCLKDVVIQTYDALFDGVRSLSAWGNPSRRYRLLTLAEDNPHPWQGASRARDRAVTRTAFPMSPTLSTCRSVGYGKNTETACLFACQGMLHNDPRAAR
jgi:Shedu protein SduA, C-terminal